MLSGHTGQADLPPTALHPGCDKFSNSRVTIMMQTQIVKKNFLVLHVISKKYIFSFADRSHRLLTTDLHRPHIW